MSAGFRKGEVVVDACCLINLYAMGRIRELLKDLGWSWYVPRAVMSELLYVRARDENGDAAPSPINTQSLLVEGLVQEVDVKDDDEVRLYVRLAADLDDGEAMALAIARHRGWKLATDDRKARRFASGLGVELVSTPEVMRRWADVGRLRPAEISEALRNIEFGARFLLGENAPERDWWVSGVASPGEM